MQTYIKTQETQQIHVAYKMAYISKIVKVGRLLANPAITDDPLA